MTKRDLPNILALQGAVRLFAEGDTEQAPFVETVDGKRRAHHDFVANTSLPNRHDDIIDQNTWELSNYNRNPVVLWMHDMHRFPLGRGEVWVEHLGSTNARLMVRVHWDLARSDAREASRQVEEGFLSAVSIHARFGQSQWRDELPESDPRYKRVGWGRCLSHGDLLEVSVVTVPGDPNAIKQALLLSMETPPPLSPEPPASPPGETMSLRALLLAALSLPDITTDEEISALAAENKKKAEDLAARLTATCRALGLPSTADEAVLGAAVAALQASVAQAATTTEEAAVALVAQAVQEGKILPAHKAHWLKHAQGDLEGARTELAALPVVAPLRSPVRRDTQLATATTRLSAEEAAAARQLGLSGEDYLAARNITTSIRAAQRGEEI